MRFFTSRGCSSTSKPAIWAVPAVGGRKQVRTRIVVVFPAPLGPRKPTICPFSTSKEISSTASVRAYRFVRPSTLIIESHLPKKANLPKRGIRRCRYKGAGCANEKLIKFYDRNHRRVLSNPGWRGETLRFSRLRSH